MSIETDKDIENIVITETPETFAHKVEEFVWEHDVSYFDAIVSISEKNKYDEVLTSSLITDTLKAKLRDELEKLNMVKKRKGVKLYDSSN